MTFTGYENQTNQELMRLARDFGSRLAVELAKRLEHTQPVSRDTRRFEEPFYKQNPKTGVTS